MLYSALITITNTNNGLSNYLSNLPNNRERSRISVGQDPEVVRVSVEAADVPAFRAAINGITQSLAVFDEVTRHG